MATFNLFVYGTLLEGQHNRRILDESLISSSRPAQVRGRLYVSGPRAGFPFLQIPLADMYRMGSTPSADILSADSIAGFKGHLLGRPSLPEDSLTPIEGELVTLVGNTDSLLSQLTRLDRLEGFDPGKPDSLYWRVLTKATSPNRKDLTWIYVLPTLAPSANPLLTQLMHGSWRVFQTQRNQENPIPFASRPQEASLA